MKLNSANIEESIRSYLAKVDELEFPKLHADKLRFIDIVKEGRLPVTSGFAVTLMLTKSKHIQRQSLTIF